MKFYLDFEATQFSERIISIGCVSENGLTFNSLVNPGVDVKLTPYIANLTGITQEQLDEASNADQAFNKFASWVYNICFWAEDPHPEYYCYGKNDFTFLDRTIKHMNNPESISFAVSVRALMIDYSKTVNKHFNLQAVGLNRVYQLLQAEEHIQKHDALEDALMLKYVQEHLGEATAEDADRLPPANNGKKKKNDTTAPTGPNCLNDADMDFYRSMEGIARHEFDTRCSKEEAKLYCVGEYNNAEYVQYFKSYKDAALYSINYRAKKPSMSSVRKNTNNALIGGAESGIRNSINANANGNKNLKYNRVFWFKMKAEEE